MKKWLIAAAVLASLAACGGNGGGSSSIGSYIAKLIGTQSCENNTPVDANTVELNTEDTNEVDVSTVTPQCG